MTHLPRAAAAVLAALLLGGLTLGATACAPGPGATSTPSSSPSASASASRSAEPTQAASPTAQATECLTGTWIMDQDALVAFYNQVNDLQDGTGAAFTPVGTATMILGADGTYSWMPEAEISAQASGIEIAISLSGRMDGTFTATATRIAGDVVTTNDLQITASINGESTDAGDVSREIAQAPLTDAAYTCSADTLSLETSMLHGTVRSDFRRG